MPTFTNFNLISIPNTFILIILLLVTILIIGYLIHYFYYKRNNYNKNIENKLQKHYACIILINHLKTKVKKYV